MFLYNLKIAFRRLRHNPFHSLVNIIGLTIGIMTCIFIYSYMSYEKSYDTFYKNYDQIYRIAFSKYLNGSISERLAKSPAALADAIRNNMPEALSTTQFYPLNEVTVTMNNKRFNESHVFWADTSFINVFSMNLMYGSLTGDGVLISESIARKYFNNPASAVNQPVSITEEENIGSIVRGVFRDVPGNTHFSYDILLFKKEDEPAGTAAWRWTGVYTYILLNKKTSPEVFSENLNLLIKDKTQGIYDFDIIPEVNLQQLGEIHLHSDLREELQPNGSYQVIIFLLIIGIIVICVAWINSINLFTADLIERTREISIRKILGSDRHGLLRQFLVEGMILSLFSGGMSLFLVYLLFPEFANICGKPLAWHLLINEVFFRIGFTGLLITGIVIYGIYPVFFLSSFDSVRALKKESDYLSASKFSPKTGLLIFQFAATTFVMITTLIVYRQLQYMMNSDLGMNINQLVVVKAPHMEKEDWSDKLVSYVIDSSYFRKKQQFKYALESTSRLNVASVSQIPGKELIWGTEGFHRENSLPEDVHSLNMQGIDYDFLKVFDIELLAGRNFSKEHTTDQLGAVLINESALHELGYTSPDEAAGSNLVFYDNSKKRIIGVIRDFHQESFKRSIRPTFYQLLPRALDYIVIRIPPQNLRISLDQIRKRWELAFPESPFDYFFLDNFFNAQYKAETRFLNIFAIFMFLAIITANTGLLGLSSYMISRRTKEIGIRKVMGASVNNLVILFSKGYMFLLLLSFCIAIPAAIYVSENWLNNYAFKSGLAWWIFVAPVLLSMVISLMTVAVQSFKYSIRNPVETLRTE